MAVRSVRVVGIIITVDQTLAPLLRLLREQRQSVWGRGLAP